MKIIVGNKGNAFVAFIVLHCRNHGLSVVKIETCNRCVSPTKNGVVSSKSLSQRMILIDLNSITAFSRLERSSPFACGFHIWFFVSFITNLGTAIQILTESLEEESEGKNKLEERETESTNSFELFSCLQAGSREQVLLLPEALRPYNNYSLES